jgi:hypothetical protein
MNPWISVDDELPETEMDVLISNSEGIEIASYSEIDEDGPDCMGHDAGFIGYKFAMAGRSFGNPQYKYPSIGQPTHWMLLPEPLVISEPEEPHCPFCGVKYAAAP